MRNQKNDDKDEEGQQKRDSSENSKNEEHYNDNGKDEGPSGFQEQENPQDAPPGTVEQQTFKQDAPSSASITNQQTSSHIESQSGEGNDENLGNTTPLCDEAESKE